MTASCRIQLFSLAATLIRPEVDGTVTVKLKHGYRFASDGWEAAVGRYEAQLLAEEPGFHLQGPVSVLCIPRERFEAVGFLKEDERCGG
jgi:hypothetical protein